MRDGHLYGDNTDGQGLVNHIASLGWDLSGTNIAIIGAGGAARGVILPLIEANIASLTLANRTLHKAETLTIELSDASSTIDQFSIKTCTTQELTGDYDVVINATSIGLTDATLPIADSLNTTHAYDMMYGRELPFLAHFEQRGAKVSDGYGMLINQAALSFEQWTGQSIDVLQATKSLA
jgi:shikimate dehydrogenase